MAKFEPYIGGAGPSLEQTIENTQALCEELQRLNIDCEFRMGRVDGIDEDLPLVYFGPDKQFTVGYDRWGFCSDQEPMLDQADWDRTIAYVQKVLANPSKYQDRL